VKLVIDANLAFSCVVRSDGAIGELLLRSSQLFQLYAPELLVAELTRHRPKLQRVAKLDEQALTTASALVLARILSSKRS